MLAQRVFDLSSSTWRYFSLICCSSSSLQPGHSIEHLARACSHAQGRRWSRLALILLAGTMLCFEIHITSITVAALGAPSGHGLSAASRPLAAGPHIVVGPSLTSANAPADSRSCVMYSSTLQETSATMTVTMLLSPPSVGCTAARRALLAC